ncbi:embryogenesis-associated protein EMB8-like protein [Tanacetum coccineum]
MSVHPSLEVSGGGLDSFLPGFTTLDRPYDAYPVICSNAHLETIFATKFRSSPYVRFRRECIWTKNKGVVALDWVAGDDRCLSPKSPILFLLAGLANGSGNSYIRHMVSAANKKGWRVVAFNSRGCGRSPVITPGFFGASFTGDVGEAIAYVSSCYPDAIFICDVEGDRCLLSGAVSLCNPFNVVLAVEELHKGFNKVYDRILGASLSKVFSRHALLFEGIEGDYNISIARNSRSCRDFDESHTRVAFGLKSADDFYQKLSSSDAIKNVCRPLLCIQENPNCMLIVTPKGGHLGWVAGTESPFGTPWTDPVVMEFLEHLEKKNGSLPQSQRKVLSVQSTVK